MSTSVYPKTPVCPVARVLPRGEHDPLIEPSRRAVHRFGRAVLTTPSLADAGCLPGARRSGLAPGNRARHFSRADKPSRIAWLYPLGGLAYEVPKTAFLPTNSESRLNIQRSCPKYSSGCPKIQLLAQKSPPGRRPAGLVVIELIRNLPIAHDPGAITKRV